MVTRALINAKNGKAAVALAIAGAGAASQALNAYLAKRQGQAVADGLKPNMDAQHEEMQALKTQLEHARQDLAKAQSEIMAQQRNIDKRNTMMGVAWYALGIATPLGLKYLLGIG